MEQQFVMKTAQGGLAEVEIGKLAQQKGNDDVKRIGETLVQDHSKANQDLKHIASQKGVTLPSSPGKHQEMMTRLSGLSGDEFNREFLKTQAMHHRMDIQEFEKVSNSAKDSDLKQFATDTLPALRKHEQMIKTAAQKLGMQLSSSGASDQMKGQTGGSSDHGSHSGASATKSQRQP
jgi:putative membrane protein